VLYAKRQIVDGFKSTKVLFKAANADIILHTESPPHSLSTIADVCSAAPLAAALAGLLTSFVKLLLYTFLGQQAV
jgi:hypothetical protein